MQTVLVSENCRGSVYGAGEELVCPICISTDALDSTSKVIVSSSLTAQSAYLIVLCLIHPLCGMM